ncbi:acyltransferase family protein [Leucobacter chironomi]|uniref:acyltransferase family protein n=1 Tax=Leucobacter chironomi TaxID=491918 RepID=UPI0009753ACE|nr:acyltransferase family protein [Leucobacter chironomi]
MSPTMAPPTGATAPIDAKPPQRAAAAAPRYRKDIDGLRAVAVLLVVVYHVWLDRVSGGVDAFLMISAFFLTGSFVRRLEAGKPLAIVSQWIRTFKRLLPAAAVVIAATVIAATFIMPASGHPDLWRHAWASLFYYENWALAAESVDYYADTSLASPLQHFWSLSVQGQVFLLWPLLFAVIAFLRWALGRRSVRAVALVCFAAVFTASLAYSIVTTQEHQESAYFNTGARVWEFAAGSILAIVLPWIRLPRLLGAIIGWLGLAALLACGMVLDVQGGFPGYLALWPVLAVAAIILAGSPEEKGFGPAILLETKPVLALGRDAYALYLVHWPILVLTLIARRGEPLGFFEGLALILVSMVLARLLTWLVDARVRRLAWANSNNFRGALVILLSILLVAVPVISFQASSAAQVAELTADEDGGPDLSKTNPGALVLQRGWNGEIDPDAPRRPLPQEIETQWGGLPESCDDGELPPLPEGLPLCWQNSMHSPSRTIVLFGNSHMQQWLPPIARIAEQERWHLVFLGYAACAFGLRDVVEGEDADIFHSPECRQWNESVLTFVEEVQPDVVMTIGAATVPTDEDADENQGALEHVLEGAETSIERLQEMDIPIILIRDNPRFTFDNFVCVEQAEAPEDCDVARSRALAPENPANALLRAGVSLVDVNDFICPGDTCPAVIGNVNVYIDDNHLSIFYTKSLAPMLAEQLVPLVKSSGDRRPSLEFD